MVGKNEIKERGIGCLRDLCPIGRLRYLHCSYDHILIIIKAYSTPMTFYRLAFDLLCGSQELKRKDFYYIKLSSFNRIASERWWTDRLNNSTYRLKNQSHKLSRGRALRARANLYLYLTYPYIYLLQAVRNTKNLPRVRHRKSLGVSLYKR